jgi:iron complex outermembrane receptor protein
MVLEDVERIEVIRGPGGPGATVWGPNAVNGVINVISKSSSETLGTYGLIGAGTEELGFITGRHGGQLSSDATYRVYGKGFERDRAFDLGSAAQDDWRMGRGGFRSDWTPTCADTITVQGDFYKGFTGRRNIFASPPPAYASVVDDDAQLVGGNALVRWTRQVSDESEWSLQTYYDRTERSYQLSTFREDRDTVDIDFQYRFKWRDRHSVICGLGYRNSRDRIRNSFPISFFPNRFSDDLFSYFVQDEVTLREDELYFTVGSKFSHSDYTPFEYQPTARVVWLPTERHSVWAAVSRAVRTPSRTEHHLQVLAPPSFLPRVFAAVIGDPTMISEELISYEIGFRSQPTEQFSWDWAAFYNRYDDLVTSSIGAPTLANIPPVVPIIPLTLRNGGGAEAIGFEVAARYEINDCLRFSSSYSFIDVNDDGGNVTESDSARNLLYTQASWDINCCWHVDMMWRYVDSLPMVSVPSYNTMDVRLGWTPTDNCEVAIVGRNLLDGKHFEFSNDAITGNVATQVQREVYGSITLRY